MRRDWFTVVFQDRWHLTNLQAAMWTCRSDCCRLCSRASVPPCRSTFCRVGRSFRPSTPCRATNSSPLVTSAESHSPTNTTCESTSRRTKTSTIPAASAHTCPGTKSYHFHSFISELVWSYSFLRKINLFHRVWKPQFNDSIIFK